MTLDQLQQEVLELTRGIEHPRVGAAVALAEECGEVMRCILDGEYYGKDVREALAGEVGDVLIALTELADRYGLRLGDCGAQALEKLRAKAPAWREELGPRLQDLRARMDGDPA
ncbi:MAG: MazG nucleotide pyrophosphohydrolase domain-containing protein [Planctomycetota bacterium]|jgi:NTP pyrophosphatase (non-canonical NTP hydrolase)